MEKGIVPIVCGGLGNQMFIISAGYIVHRLNNLPLYIFNNTLSNNNHNKEKLNYKNSIFKNVGKHINIPYTDIQKLYDFKDYTYHSHTMNFGYDEWDPKIVKKGILMSSYYQYYPVLSEFENELRSIFLSGISDNLEKIKNDLKTCENDAFLHVRRGDYLNLSDIHYIQPISYYYNCVDKLLKENNNIKRIFVLSDDVLWIKNEDFFKKELFYIVEDLNEIDSLALMSLCKGGSICANSTFSWWGAFLGAYEYRNPIYVPKKWINLNKDICNLFPKEWNKE